MRRKNRLVTGEVYHIFNKSIAEFKIFNTETEYSRIIATMRYYQVKGHLLRFSHFIESQSARIENLSSYLNDYLRDKEKAVEIIAYCIMPTHIHLILKQLVEKGISIVMNNILNSYSRYFNTKHKRKGPLWEGRFKNVLIKTDEQLLHLTRYIHLNPITACLVDKPEFWNASSYKEYLSGKENNKRICRYEDLLTIVPSSYRKFVEDRISYQRELAKIKNLIFE